jgi:lambda family phage tail tape measure protein
MPTAPGLAIEVSANSAKFDSDMSRIAQIARTKGQDIKATMLDAANQATHGFTVLGEKIGLLENPISQSIAKFGQLGAAAGVVVGVGAYFTEAVIKAVEMGESMADLSIKTGLTVESISKFATVARLSGTEMDTVAGLMKKLSISSVEATAGNKNLAAVYEAIGISVRELKTLAPDELMVRVAKAVQGLDPMVTQDVMRQIGGKGGSEALVFLRELNERFDDTHAKISTQFATDAKEFSDNLKIMTENTKYLGVAFASQLLPQINLAIEAFRKARLEGEGFWASMSKAWQMEGQIAGIDLSHVNQEIMSVKYQIELLDKEGENSVFFKGLKDKNPFGITGKTREELERTLKVLEEYKAKNNLGLANPLDADKNNDARNALGLKNHTAGDNFLKGLEAQISKVDQGKFAMLELQAAEKGVATEAEPLIQKLKQLDEGRAAKFYEDALTRQNSDIDFQQSLIGKTAQEVEILNVQHKNTIELQKQIEQITKTNGELSQATIQRMTDATNTATAYQIQSITQRQAAERDWSVGASRTMSEYAYAAGNAAEGAKTVFTNGFRNMEDAIVSFATTGKLSFSTFANSLIADMIRIQARAMISSATSGMFGSLFNPGYGSATEGSANFIGPLQSMSANGNVFSNGSLTAFANGGVISSPTLFPMSGGSTGLMGEAGPEAVMPLTRAANGKLGVKNLNPSSGGGTVNITVNNEAGGDGYEAVATAKKNDAGFDIEVLVRKAMAKDLRSNGPMSQQISNIYGLRRSI